LKNVKREIEGERRRGIREENGGRADAGQKPVSFLFNGGVAKKKLGSRAVSHLYTKLHYPSISKKSGPRGRSRAGRRMETNPRSEKITRENTLRKT